MCHLSLWVSKNTGISLPLLSLFFPSYSYSLYALSLHSWRWRDWFVNKEPSFPPFGLWIKPFLLPHTHFLVIFLEGEDNSPSVLSDEDASPSEPSDEDTSPSGPSDEDTSPTWTQWWRCLPHLDLSLEMSQIYRLLHTCHNHVNI